MKKSAGLLVVAGRAAAFGYTRFTLKASPLRPGQEGTATAAVFCSMIPPMGGFSLGLTAIDPAAAEAQPKPHSRAWLVWDLSV
ncbi:hypothetical protein [Paenibacillus donghaensis]|uniref:Uncharacterized protein n=1 Tax=Paenibacillus donghaensis TaxID=414771 RepID=A0A2Z2KBL8_9BACL|nr:hypothetical protein [Paenibacillus donghaensis]ASA20303.1 hypothetical protein B9T62_05510 [Paenibacillus donghaensis]